MFLIRFNFLYTQCVNNIIIKFIIIKFSQREFNIKFLFDFKYLIVIIITISYYIDYNGYYCNGNLFECIFMFM